LTDEIEHVTQWPHRRDLRIRFPVDSATPDIGGSAARSPRLRIGDPANARERPQRFALGVALAR